MSVRPPGLPNWIRRALPADVQGDLEEAFRRRLASRGRLRAWSWVLLQSLRIRLGLWRMDSVPLDGAGSLHASSRSLDVLRQDVRFAVRGLMRRPTSSAVVVLTLAIVIGATTTMFSLVNSLFLGSTLVRQPDRVVEVYGTRERDAHVGGFQGFLPVSFPNAMDLRESSSSFQGAYAYTTWQVSLELGDEPERVDVMYVSAEYFDVLGVPAHLGRTFHPNEDDAGGGSPVAVISHALWQDRLGGDPDVLGRTFRINARAYTIVGVAPAGFRGTSSTLLRDIWLPVSMVVDVPVWGDLWDSRTSRFFFVGARLAPGRTLEQAAAELNGVWGRLNETHNLRNSGLRLLPLLEARVNPNLRAVVSGISAVLMAVVSILLLIACLNVANLLLARAVERAREMAIRTSVGARRGRLVAQLLTETLVLFCAGGAAGLALALVGQTLLDGVRPPALFGAALEVRMDVRVILFTGTVSLACGLLFGLVPALRASQTDLSGQLRDGDRGGSRRGHWLQTGLVAGQVALSLVALVGAGLFLKSLDRAARVPLGFEPEGLALFSVDLGANGYSEGEGRAFYQDVLRAVEEVPSVESAAIGSLRPLTLGPLRTVFRPDEDPEDGNAGTMAREHLVSAAYDLTVGAPLVRGRGLEQGDGLEGRAVAVVNQRMAEAFWPDADPIGRQFRIGIPPQDVTVVGVVANAKYGSVSEDPLVAYFRPAAQRYAPTFTVFARSRSGPVDLWAVRQAIQSVDSSLPVFDVTHAHRLVDQALWNTRAVAAVLGAFGLLGLILAAVGIYGVVANSVRKRTREIGLRMALGASGPRLVACMVGGVVRVTGLGLAVGAALAALLGGPVASQLLGVSHRDPATYAAMAAILLTVAVVAGYIPARRAAGVDVAEALGAE